MAWLPARFDHSNVTAQCYTCHNGTTATGKSPGHISSSNTCDDCHNTNTWEGARFDHSNITTQCLTCHNGTTATGKPQDHIQSGTACEDCHSTNAWLPASFDHANITTGCDACHNGVIATGKDNNHFITTQQCNVCHSSSYWIPALNYDHQSLRYPGDHTGSNPQCIDCHTSNSQTVSWPSSAYVPECAACHAGDYRQDKHENLPISGLIDCAGTCHKPDPEHNVRHGDWGN